MNSSRISIHPAQPGDYKRLAYLESSAFGDDEFTRLAFGPHREDNDVLEARAKEMREPMNPGEIEKLVKAVRIDVDGREEIVGFAQWRTVHVSEGGVGFYAVAEEEGEQGKRKEEEVELKKDEDGSEGKNVATVVNEKLCNDLFIPGDAYMAKVCNGRDYQKLFQLDVSRDYQRQGIGTLLLRAGLEEADEVGLQCVLGASPEGLSLYERHGFSVVQHMSLNLWEYEGGEGMGTVNHYIMHRPARRNE